MRKKIPVNEARNMLIALAAVPGTETVPLAESFGHILAEDLRAVVPVPPFDRSPYDGYAFRGEDTAGSTVENPVILKITEEIPAGHTPQYAIEPGFAAKILTGAPLPAGANSTIKYELTKYTNTEVMIFAPVEPNSDVVPAGEDIKAGALLARSGETLTAPLIGMAAAQGFAQLKVFRKPVISILNTGTELLEVGTPLEPAKIYNSNSYMIAAFLSAHGAKPLLGGAVADDPDEIAERIGRLLELSDMVITTGGASVGDYDWAVTASERLGARILFWKTAMKPGGSMLAAVKDGKLILGLSGNPGAAAIGLLMVGMPYISRLCGKKDFLPESFFVRLYESYEKKSPVTRYLGGRLEIKDSIAYFVRSEGEGNGMVSPLLGCDVVAEIPEEGSPMEAGDMIRVFRI